MQFIPEGYRSLSILTLCLVIAASVFSIKPSRADLRWSGNLSMEMQNFRHKPQNGEQSQMYGSVALKPKLTYDWQGGKQSIVFSGFARVGETNDSRAHLDIREMAWNRTSEQWELRMGVRKVFWGVTESQHLVDIINQTDTLEGIDGEEKLGQLMLNLALIRDWGTVDMYVLPGFRERDFTGSEGRLRPSLPVDRTLTQYESSSQERNIDLAVRWSHYIGDWDIGLSHFYGTSREPRLIPYMGPGGLVLTPYYDLIQQTGLDLQATIGRWLWKAEAIRRSGMGQPFFATVAGLEYSFFNLVSSGIDIGVVMEYMFDDRKHKAGNPFNNDLLLALRFAFNDKQSTDALIGIVRDLDGRGNIVSVEASRRLGDSFKLKIEGNLFYGIKEGDILSSLSKDDYVQVELGYYF